MNSNEEYNGIRNRLSIEYLKDKTKNNEIEIESVELNETGIYEEQGKLFGIIPHTKETELPSYFRIIIKKKMNGNYIAKITIHLPLVWNERFIGITGGGSATYQDYQQYLYATSTPWTIAIRNHFACSETDCGIGFDNYSFGFKKDSNEIDWDLLREWGYEAAHENAVIGKLITTLAYDKAPVYCYVTGISAGARTVHGEVQRYPLDYNGIWAQCAAVPWIPHLLSQTWVYFVMNFEKHFISKEKLKAFYNGFLKEHNLENQGYFDKCYFPEFDPYHLVGIETSDGKITQEDAKIMKIIYDGPCYSDGRPMSKCDALGPSIRYADFLLYDESGKNPTGTLSLTALQGFRWALRNKTLEFKDIIRQDFDYMYDIAISSFKDIGNQDPDIKDFRDAGGKLILTHATSDNCVPLATTLKYYNNVCKYEGNEEELRKYVSCFISRGGGHGESKGIGEIISFPDVWSALMIWVEDGKFPEELPTQRWNDKEQKVEYSGRNEKAYSINNIENENLKTKFNL